MRRKEASAEALEKMRAADNEAIWTGRFRCCNLAVTGTRPQVLKLQQEHICGSSSRPDTADQPAAG